jgi:hypothetical protein
VWLALADQIVVISVLPDWHALSEGAHLASYGLAALFAVLNHRSAGTWIVGAGGACNLVAMVANGGTMPASSAALKASGWRAPSGHFSNSAALPNPRLGFLGDVFATPSWLPTHSVFSFGDIMIVIGVAVFLHMICHRTGPATLTRSDQEPTVSTQGGNAGGACGQRSDVRFGD